MFINEHAHKWWSEGSQESSNFQGKWEVTSPKKQNLI
jgi:hypothetical protein